MASKPLTNDEAKDLMKQLGMADASAKSDKRGSKKGGAGDSSVAQLLSELYRSDVGRWPPHIKRG